MFTSELDYDLPPGLIAKRPAEPRDSCRLLVVSRSDPRRMEHLTFTDLPSLLGEGDLAVFNTSRVLAARLLGRRSDTGAAVEGLFVREHPREDAPALWRVMLKTGTRLRPGMLITLHDATGHESGVALRLVERDDDQWLAEPMGSPGGAAWTQGAPALLARIGATPIPPYIRKARRDAHEQVADELDRAWYQCVYAGESGRTGSVAAPTAGLHFTIGVLDALRARGVERSDVRLHVGPGTFKPVQTETLEAHPIHAEWALVPPDAVRALERARARGGRVVAVGTTSVRAVESLPHPLTDHERTSGYEGETRLFITPGYRFRHTDALVTNFHLPRSTLLAMVAALFEDGTRRILAIYREAVRREYRFYSYGDAMLILP